MDSRLDDDVLETGEVENMYRSEFASLEKINAQDKQIIEFAQSVSHIGTPMLLSMQKSHMSYKSMTILFEKLEKEPRRQFDAECYDGMTSVHPLLYTVPVRHNFDLMVAEYEEMANIYRYGLGIKPFKTTSGIESTLCTTLCDCEFETLFPLRESIRADDFSFVGEYRFSMRLEVAISIFSEQGVCELTRLTKGQLYKKIEILQQDRTKDPRGLYLLLSFY
jgi:hypothetical protein